MELALTFQDVVPAQGTAPISFQVGRGTVAAAVTSRQDETDRLVRLILGLTKPVAGKVVTLGVEVASAAEKELIALRRRATAVHYSGGLVSNLKVWENLVLPLQYHCVCGPDEVEARGMAMLRTLGYTGRLMELPAHLSLYEKRLIGIGRAMLTEPELIVYNGILGGLRGDEREKIVSIALEFQWKNPKRSSLFITSNPETLAGIPFDNRSYLNGSLHDT